MDVPAICLAATYSRGEVSPMLVSADFREAAAGGAGKRQYVRQIFSEIAPRYDLLNHLLSFNIDRGWRREAIATLNWLRAPRSTYLDLCAGTLDVAAALAATRGFAGDVIGTDFAEPMLRGGAEKTIGLSVRPVAGDALELPFRSGSMAGAVVAFGIRNVADLDRGLREAGATELDNSGFLVRAFYQFYLNRLLPFVGRLVSGHPTAYSYLPKSVAHFPAEDALADRMRAAGFVDVGWRALTFGVVAIHVGVKSS